MPRNMMGLMHVHGAIAVSLHPHEQWISLLSLAPAEGKSAPALACGGPRISSSGPARAPCRPTYTPHPPPIAAATWAARTRFARSPPRRHVGRALRHTRCAHHDGPWTQRVPRKLSKYSHCGHRHAQQISTWAMTCTLRARCATRVRLAPTMHVLIYRLMLLAPRLSHPLATHPDHHIFYLACQRLRPSAAPASSSYTLLPSAAPPLHPSSGHVCTSRPGVITCSGRAFAFLLGHPPTRACLARGAVLCLPGRCSLHLPLFCVWPPLCAGALSPPESGLTFDLFVLSWPAGGDGRCTRMRTTFRHASRQHVYQGLLVLQSTGTASDASQRMQRVLRGVLRAWFSPAGERPLRCTCTVWFGFARPELLLAVAFCWVDHCVSSWVWLGSFCLHRATHTDRPWLLTSGESRHERHALERRGRLLSWSACAAPQPMSTQGCVPMDEIELWRHPSCCCGCTCCGMLLKKGTHTVHDVRACRGAAVGFLRLLRALLACRVWLQSCLHEL